MRGTPVRPSTLLGQVNNADVATALNEIADMLEVGDAKTAQTERLLRALDNPNVTIVAHPTGRLIGQREPYDIDMEKILRKARARSCFVERPMFSTPGHLAHCENC